MSAARVAADDQRLAVFEPADHLRPMAAALRTELRRRWFGLFGSSVMNHDVIYRRNVFAKRVRYLKLLARRHLVMPRAQSPACKSFRNGTRACQKNSRVVVKFPFGHSTDANELNLGSNRDSEGVCGLRTQDVVVGSVSLAARST